MANNSWKEYFVLSRKDRLGIIVLLLLLTATIGALEAFRNRSDDPVVITPLLLVKDTSEPAPVNSPVYYSGKPDPKEPVGPAKLFYFDPNTLEEEGFVKLGLRPRTARTLINYRNKGGKFRHPEDLRKIYNLTKEEADRLVPYVRIAEEFKPKNYDNRYEVKNTSAVVSAPTVIDINTAEVAGWRQLPGLTPSMAYRIVNFREKIGGFFDVMEVRQTYGITDSSWQLMQPYLQVKEATKPKLNINAASSFEMGMHPVIGRDVAKAIVVYRSQNGEFKSLEDLKKIAFINEELFGRIAPYLKAE